MHSAAVAADNAKKLWGSQSDSHSWVAVMKKYEENLISNLIRIAVDVYNDSVIKTLSAWSWPSRSLAQQHAENQVAYYRDYGLDCPFAPFEPTDGSLRYKNPTQYSEMLEIVAYLEQERVTTLLKQADCISLQVDKSLDKYNVEGLFITARYFDREYGFKSSIPW